MTVKPRPGFLTLEQVEVTDRSKSGLFVPTKAKAFKVLACGSDTFTEGQIVILGGSEKLTVLDLPMKTVIVASETSVQATIDEGA
jgi:hypothetical protein